jgi:Spy/CpxP family protein refolding chaperone
MSFPWKTVAGALAALLALSGAAQAQPGPGPEDGPMRGPRPPSHNEFVERVASDLGLGKATLEKARALAKEADLRSAVVDSKLRSAFHELRRLMDEESPDRKLVLAQVEKIGSLETEQKKIMTEVLLSVRELLSPEQRAQLKAIMERHRQEGGPPGERQGPPGRPG